MLPSLKYHNLKLQSIQIGRLAEQAIGHSGHVEHKRLLTSWTTSFRFLWFMIWRYEGGVCWMDVKGCGSISSISTWRYFRLSGVKIWGIKKVRNYPSPERLHWYSCSIHNTNHQQSLLEAEVPSCFKFAINIPLLKKQSLDPDIFKHYRPISNLAFLSKVLARIVAMHLNAHTDHHPKSETLQSSYKKYLPTETALVKIQSYILTSLDHQQCVVLLLFRFIRGLWHCGSSYSSWPS